MTLVTQLLLLGLLAFFTLYLGYELVRWFRGNTGSLTPGQFRRRIWGGALLELDLLLWLLYPLISHRHAREQLLYLLVGVLLVVIAMLLAVREAAFVTRQFLRWRGEMVRSFAPSDPDGGGADTRDA